MEAIRLAGTLATEKHPAVRLAAKEVLIDAHLGAAHDIAWGEWDDKTEAVPRWLARAAAVVEDVIANESGDEEHQFRVATRALAACVGMRGEIDPAQWTQDALQTGQVLVESAANHPERASRLRWELGMALYDALQVYQMRGEHDKALQFGEQAIGYLEQAGNGPASPTTSYLLGRLYFRLGAIHAVRDGNHRAAITWFDKAMPELSKPVPPGAFAEIGRHGETFVSMGVSYWETRQREKAVELTEHGLKLMQQAVEQGTLQASALTVPYSNLSSMHRQMGQEDRARQFEQLATQPQGTKLK
jgi:tetratricopeptide (TPR) repeat protein